MRLFQAPLDTCLDSPFFAGLSVHGLHFTVYAPSTFVLLAIPFTFENGFERLEQRPIGSPITLATVLETP